MAIILDLLLVAIVVINIIICVKQGFAKALFKTLGFVLALVIAFIFTKPISSLISSAFMEEKVHNRVEKIVMNETITGSVDDIIDGFYKNTEDLRGMLDMLHVDFDGVIDDVRKDVNEKGEDVKKAIVERVSTYLTKMLSTIIAFVIIFLVALLAIFLVSLALRLVSKIPVLHTFDKLLGFVFGLLKGLIVAYFLAVFLGALLPSIISVFSESTWYGEAVQDTVLLRTITSSNPIMTVIRSFFG